MRVRCPKCGEEYREGFFVCADCGVDIVEVDLDQADQRENLVHESRALLKTTADEMEAGLVYGLLDSAGIPVYKGYPEAGSYVKAIMGNTIFGVNIYVPESCLEEAEELLEMMENPGEDPGETISQAEESYMQRKEEGHRKRQRLKVWVLIWAFFVPGLLLSAMILFYTLFRIIQGFFF